MRTAYRVAISSGLAFALLAILVAAEWSPLIELDHDVVGPATDLARDHDGYRALMAGATWLLNSPLVLAYAGLLSLGLALRGRSAPAIWLVVVVGLGTFVNPLLKQVFGRDRPTVTEPVETFRGLSFPSGHANSAALISAGLIVVLWSRVGRPARIAAAVAAVAIPVLSSWTRMTLGGHYLSDVVAGTLLGITWVALWQPALPALERSITSPVARPR